MQLGGLVTANAFCYSRSEMNTVLYSVLCALFLPAGLRVVLIRRLFLFSFLL